MDAMRFDIDGGGISRGAPCATAAPVSRRCNYGKDGGVIASSTRKLPSYAYESGAFDQYADRACLLHARTPVGLVRNLDVDCHADE